VLAGLTAAAFLGCAGLNLTGDAETASDPAAQYDLGVAYLRGDGVAQDDRKAVQWFRKAAKQGYAPAQNRLGICYLRGQGVKRDTAEAVRWYRRAAEQGHVAAQTNLGSAYYRGEGVPQDYARAVSL